MVGTVVATTARVTIAAARMTETGAKRVTALTAMTATMATMVTTVTTGTMTTMATTATMMPNGNDDAKRLQRQ